MHTSLGRRLRNSKSHADEQIHTKEPKCSDFSGSILKGRKEV